MKLNFRWLVRYGGALAAVGASLLVRLGLTTLVGEGLPTYITFYPAVMAAALLGGLGPGLLATAAAALATDYWILPPHGFGVERLVDAVGLAFFGGMGLFMSTVAEFYRRHRHKAAAYDREAALREIQARLATFAAATFEGIVESEAGRIMDCNEQLARMLGYSVAELRGMEIASLIAPEDRDRVVANIRQGRESMTEDTVLRNDGTRIVVEAHGRPVAPGSATRHTAIRDITERKRREEELRQSEERYRGLVELSPEGLFVNRNDRIVLVNPAALQLFGASGAEQLLGKSPFAVFHPDCHVVMRERVSKLLAGQWAPVLEEKIVRLDGAVVDVEVVAAPVMDQGERAILVLLRDITERKRAQAALQAATAELERSNRDLEQFAYVASHDLQEPLRAVGGYVKLLQHRFPDKLDAKARDYVAGAFEGATRMERLITDLLAFSRVGTHGGSLVPSDLKGVLDQTLRNLQAGIESAHATVTHDPLPTLSVDATQIMQLFQNLIGNALKFHGGQPPMIHVGAQRQEGRWVFSVRDNGIGIEPQYYEKIFHIFQRLHTRKEYPGTGIGLAICKKIVERHGGTIWVESQPGAGSTFYFSILEAAAEPSRS